MTKSGQHQKKKEWQAERRKGKLGSSGIEMKNVAANQVPEHAFKINGVAAMNDAVVTMMIKEVWHKASDALPLQQQLHVWCAVD